jgi:hypothetical protein
MIVGVKAICLVAISLLLFGCGHTKVVTISARPPDASIKIDGRERGRGPIVQRFAFPTGREVYRVTASRTGRVERTELITRDYSRRDLVLNLDPRKHRVNVTVQPAPAVLKLDGKPLTSEPVSVFTKELEFTTDPRTNQWTRYTLTAERENYQTATIELYWPELKPTYTLTLEPLRKDLRIRTTPPGAQVYLDGEGIGQSPLEDLNRAFPVDLDTNEFLPRTLKVSMPGYEPIEVPISWDDGRSEYHIELEPKAKTVRIVTDPPDARVELDGQELARDESGAAKATLKFTPINESGELRTYEGKVTREPSHEPQPFTLAWDNGRSDYRLTLKPVPQKPAPPPAPVVPERPRDLVPLLSVAWSRDGGAWSPRAKNADVVFAPPSDAPEGPANVKAARITPSPQGMTVDAIAVSPDGTRLLLTALAGGAGDDPLRSQILLVRTDGTGRTETLTDGNTLDLTPAFSPGGDLVLFASNRAGRKLSLWQTPAASGSNVATQLTSGENHDLWPSLDSDPRPNLYYQSLIDGRNDPMLFASPMNTTTLRRDMHLAGAQPRVSPANDWVLFTAVDAKTGKRDLWRVAAAGGAPQNLTRTPDVDESDPVWSRDGGRIAFASDRSTDAKKRRHFDVWVMDVSRPDRITQITSNASHDDSPAWDPAGRSLYFRSNRGGEWSVWKIPIK